MDRIVEFRGKMIDNGQWVYGFLDYGNINRKNTEEQTHTYFITKLSHTANGRGHCKSCIGVLEETIGEYTGKKDKNGKKIYEGDIVKVGNLYYEVIFDEYMFNLKGYYDSTADYPTIAFSECICELAGNIHDNPELLMEVQ